MANLVPEFDNNLRSAELVLLTNLYLKKFGNSTLKNSVTWIVQVFDLTQEMFDWNWSMDMIIE